MLSNLLWVVLLQIGHTAVAQDDVRENVELKSFEFLIGEWEGTGSTMTRDRGMVQFEVVESIRYELDSTIILLRGTGYSESVIMHDALAVLYVDPLNNGYQLHSFIRQGLNTIAQIELTGDQSFKWWFSDGSGGTITYTATISADTWTESGSYSTPDGRTFPTMSMVLTRSQ